MKNKIVIIITALFIIACQKDDSLNFFDSQNPLLGNWSNGQYKNQETTYYRVDSLNKNKPGISFKENGVFVERTSGFCGTPPLTFFNENGKWKVVNDSLFIERKEGHYMGNVNFKIVELTKEKLVLKRIYSKQEKDHENLMGLFHEIKELSQSVSCTNSTDWKMVAYGSKACGGPQGYIAYSTKINVDVFLEKVAKYTKAEDEYNKKWSIVSTCDVTAKPKTIECENGLPVLKY